MTSLNRVGCSTGLGAFQDPVHIYRDGAKLLVVIDPVRHERSSVLTRA